MNEKSGEGSGVTTVMRYPSPLGIITLAGDGEALTGLWLEGQRHFGADPAWPAEDSPVLRLAARWLDAYFAGEEPDFTPPLRLRGTDFQRAVWQALLLIPYGRTVTYGALAASLPGGCARAVGGAVGRNPVSIIVPCHRVIPAGGGLGGYAGGTARKEWLLRLEKSTAV